MKSLLEKVSSLDDFIRQLYKIDSKMNSGQFIQAWRENRRLIAFLEKSKQAIIEAEGEDDAK